MSNPDIKNRFTGEIIIPAGKYTSIKEAVEKEYKNLSEANLSEANLYGANLSEANLYGANLYGANLSEANLSGANLSEANLSWADLYGEKITKSPIQIAGFRWWINITEKHIQIGCRVHKAEEWFNFSNEQIAEMHNEALEWWKKHKDIIKTMWEFHTTTEFKK